MSKTFEQRIADLIRRLGTNFDGEKIATVNALERLLASHSVTFNDLGDGIEKLATGGLEEAAMERIYAAARAEGLEEGKRQERAKSGFGSEETPEWERIALYCQREKARIEARHHQFIDDMASRFVWGLEPSEKQGKYLLSLFRRIGGRLA